MSDRHSNIAGIRMLVIGASSGIGQALAHAAHARGARVALAARRVDLLTELAEKLDGSAHELDVSKPSGDRRSRQYGRRDVRRTRRHRVYQRGGSVRSD